MQVISDLVDLACRCVIFVSSISLQTTYHACDSHVVVFADFQPRPVLLGHMAILCLGLRLATSVLEVNEEEMERSSSSNMSK